MSRSPIRSTRYDDYNGEPDSGANGGGRAPFASSCAVGCRHRSLFALGVATRMKMSQPLVAFVVLLAIHSLVSLGAYRFLTTTTRMPLPVDSTPVETTTSEQRARGESSFEILTGREQVEISVPWSVRLYVAFGYAGLAMALVIALAYQFRSSAP